MGFLGVAGASLQSLSIVARDDDSGSHHLEELARLTQLTRLELNEVYYTEGLSALRHLPVEELVLFDCPGAEEKLLAPGALTALRKLHSEEDEDYNPSHEMLGDMRRLSRADQQQLQAVGDALLERPQLHQISGKCHLVENCMRAGLEDWHKSSLSRSSLVPALEPHFYYDSPIECWTRPDSL